MTSESHKVPKVAIFLVLLDSACRLQHKNEKVMRNTNRATMFDASATASKGPAVCATISGLRITIDMTLQIPITRSKSLQARVNGKGMVSQTTDVDGAMQ